MLYIDGSFSKYVIERVLKLIEAIDVIKLDELYKRTYILLASTIKRPLSLKVSEVVPSMYCIDYVTTPVEEIIIWIYILSMLVPVTAIKTEDPSGWTNNSSDEKPVIELWLSE